MEKVKEVKLVAKTEVTPFGVRVFVSVYDGDVYRSGEKVVEVDSIKDYLQEMSLALLESTFDSLDQQFSAHIHRRR